MSGTVVWLTGLPASGKSTLAAVVRQRLDADRVAACVLDSDDVRAALAPSPAYTPAGRNALYQTLAQLGALLARQGLVVLVPATAHHRRYREMARRLAPSFVEVYVDAPVDECATRDIKGLYAAANAGEISSLPGVNVAYEPPIAPDVVAHGGLDERAADAVIERLAQVSRLRPATRQCGRSPARS